MLNIDPEQLKQIAAAMAKEPGRDIDPEKVVGRFQESMRAQEEKARRDKQAASEFYRHQSSLLERHRGKRLEISTNFFNDAMGELRDSFIRGKEGGMLAFFKPAEDALYCNEFYGNDWIQRNGYGISSPMDIWLQGTVSSSGGYTILYSFGFRLDRLTHLMRRRNRDELLVTCHTHHKIAYPSESDAKPYSLKMIVGFRQETDELNRLVSDCCHPPRLEAVTEMPKYHGQMPAREWRAYLQTLKEGKIKRPTSNNVPPEIYAGVAEKSEPTIRLFHTDERGNISRLPLYVNGSELL